MEEGLSHVKRREILFQRIHPDPKQAHTAAAVLIDLHGVERAAPFSDSGLHVHYDLRHISLQVIDALLTDLGFHLESSLLSKLKRALYYYTEETERINAGCGTEHTFPSTQIFTTCYRTHPHGCRDHRPRHWRDYR